MNQLASLSNKELFSIGLNATAGAVNFYLAPVSFGLGFSVAFTTGLAIGCKRQCSLILIECNKQLVTLAKESLNVDLSNTSEVIKNQVSILKDKTPPFVLTLLSIYLWISGWGESFALVGSYFSGFNEQKAEMLNLLKPVPGKIGTFFSLSALNVNINYLAVPLLSKMWLFSGVPTGYSSGLFTTNLLFESLYGKVDVLNALSLQE